MIGLAAVTSADLAATAEVLEMMPVGERGLVWLDAYERAYRSELIRRLARPEAPDQAGRPAAQLVCCIDGRSEGLRRHLEALGDYETLGFAGFFAVAIRFQDLAGGRPTALCPVLVEARTEIREGPADGASALAERRVSGLRTIGAAEDAFHSAKDAMLSPFALAEASGWVAGPLAAAKTLSAGPYGELRERLHRRLAPRRRRRSTSTRPSASRSVHCSGRSHSG